MNELPKDPLEPTEEQLRYAAVLARGMYLGLFCLFVTYTLYLTGIMPSYLPLEELPSRWSMNVHDYLTGAEIEAGWGWLKMLKYGDFVNFIGIATLAGVTIFCYLSIVPILLKKKDMIYVVLALLEVLVLAVAASGILGSGGH